MATVQEIIDQGKSYSALNDASLTDNTALLTLVTHLLRELFASAPYLQLVKTSVGAPGAGNPWDTTTLDTTLIVRVEKGDGTKVNVVDVDDEDAAFDPRVYRVGRLFYAPGSDPDPSTDSLTFVCGGEPTNPASVGSSIDTDFPPRYERILVLEVAKWYALRDGRADEAAVIEQDLVRLRGQFLSEVGVYADMADEHTYPAR